MSDLSEFLLARIAEDEAEVARWQAAMEADEVAARGVPSWVVMAGGLKIPRHVLAECEAKRRIVELHQPGHAGEAWTCGEDNYSWPCHTVRLLALPYGGHPDYREEWRP